jgi:asparagine synthetase B (glutamine-hydrolysing)
VSKYLVWREDADREDGRRIDANYEREAAEKWAEWDDAWSADYSIVRGNEARVFAALDEPGSKPLLFEVRGESQPVYFATLQNP